MSIPQQTQRRFQSVSSTRRDASAKQRQPDSTTVLLAEIGFDVWSVCNRVWVDVLKKPDSSEAVTQERILKKLRKEKPFTYNWFMKDGYAGEGLRLELVIPPIDTGTRLRWWYTSQLGNGPVRSVPLMSPTDYQVEALFRGEGRGKIDKL